jgi:vacuolar-type H+-ATPase subunit F/Vma7
MRRSNRNKSMKRKYMTGLMLTEKGFERVYLNESSDKIEKIVKTIKSALLIGSLSTFLWLVKGPKDLPGFKDLDKAGTGITLDKSPWIKDKYSEYEKGNEEKEEIVYIPILRKKIDTMTAYVPEDTRQTDPDPEHAACGKYKHIVKKGINIIAVSRDIFFDEKLREMLRKHRPLCGLPAVVKLKDGSEIKGIIMDTMNKRYKNRADLGISKYMHGNSIEKAREKAFEFGKREAEEIVVFLPASKGALEESLRKIMVKEALKKLLESAVKPSKKRTGDQNQMDVDRGERIG